MSIKPRSAEDAQPPFAWSNAFPVQVKPNENKKLYNRLKPADRLRESHQLNIASVRAARRRNYRHR